MWVHADALLGAVCALFESSDCRHCPGAQALVLLPRYHSLPSNLIPNNLSPFTTSDLTYYDSYNAKAYNL